MKWRTQNRVLCDRRKILIVRDLRFVLWFVEVRRRDAQGVVLICLQTRIYYRVFVKWYPIHLQILFRLINIWHQMKSVNLSSWWLLEFAHLFQTQLELESFWQILSLDLNWLCIFLSVLVVIYSGQVHRSLHLCRAVAKVLIFVFRKLVN
jgi:hypothetical protein